MLEAVRTAYQGDVVGQTYEGNAVFNVVVELDRPTRTRLPALKDLPIKTPSGKIPQRNRLQIHVMPPAEGLSAGIVGIATWRR